jgi:hypothetical protein
MLSISDSLSVVLLSVSCCLNIYSSSFPFTSSCFSAIAGLYDLHMYAVFSAYLRQPLYACLFVCSSLYLIVP